MPVALAVAAGRRSTGARCRRGSYRCRPAARAGPSRARGACASAGSRHRGRPATRPAQHVVVVDAARRQHLLVRGADRRSDGGRAPAGRRGCRRRARAPPAGCRWRRPGCTRPPGRSAGARRWSLTLPVEVEVRVIGQVHDGRRVGRRHQSPPCTAVVDDLDAVTRTVTSPGNPWSPSGLTRASTASSRSCLRHDVPQPPVEAVRARRAGWLPRSWAATTTSLPSSSKPTAGDPVGVASDGAAEVVARLARWSAGVGVAEHHVAPHAVASGDLEPVDGRAQVQQVQHRARAPHPAPVGVRLDRREGRRTRWLTWSEPSDEIAEGSGSLDPEPSA